MIKHFLKGDVGALSEHFFLEEFQCHCKYDSCKETIIDTDLIDKLEVLRKHFGKSVHINCGFRCAKHNAELKGAASQSQHKLGKAADIQVAGVSPDQVYQYADSVFKGVGRYNDFTHVDVRDGNRARWDYKK